MPKRKQTTSRSNQYTLEAVTWNKYGNEWRSVGQGEWLGINHVQRQIEMLKTSLGIPLEITITKHGQMLDYNGNPTDKPIRYE